MGNETHGLVLSHHIINVVRVAAEIFFEETLFSSTCGDVIMCAALYVGQFEDRPFTAAKLADFIGMPRPTAIRKLADLRKRGLVTVEDRRYWRIAVEEGGNSERIEQSIGRLLAVLNRTNAELSKMDGRTVADKTKT